MLWESSHVSHSFQLLQFLLFFVLLSYHHNNWLISWIEKERTVLRYCECFFFGIPHYCLLWIAMAEHHVCLSAMGVIWLSEAPWVRPARPGHEEVKLLPLPHRRTCFEQIKVVMIKKGEYSSCIWTHTTINTMLYILYHFSCSLDFLLECTSS